jgi:hypothetical protein
MEDAVLEVGGRPYLLVLGAQRCHAVRTTDDAAEGHAVFPTWAPKTLCGLAWALKADPDGDPHYGWPPAVAPSCARCTNALLVGATSSPLDDRVPAVAELIASSVREHGCAICGGVPGDQQERLREEVRRLLRGEGRRIRTLFRDSFGVLVADENFRVELPGWPNLELAPLRPVRPPWRLDWLDH